MIAMNEKANLQEESTLLLNKSETVPLHFTAHESSSLRTLVLEHLFK